VTTEQDSGAITAVPPSKPWQRVAREIDLPPRTAVWVLTAHLLTILVPLVLVMAVASNIDFLDTVMDQPELLYVAAGLFIVASVCESAQNTLDRWYLTGTPPSMLDLLFNSLIVLALALQILAVVGDTTWVWPVALIGALLFPVAYLMGWPTPPIQAVMGLASAVLLYRVLDQPVVFITLVTVFFTLFFLDILLRTMQQVMHGFTTLVNAFSVASVAAAIYWAAEGDAGWSWPVVIGLTAALVALAFALRPWLLRLPPTPRRKPVPGDWPSSV
jgi:hypothetical protein